MPVSPRLHLSALSPEATLPKSGSLVCPGANHSQGFIQAGIFQLDRVLRRWQGIYEFCHADDCLLRVALARAKKRVDLPDGREIRPGDEVLEIHWWNEHVARLVADKPALARAKCLLALVQHSFEQLAKYLASAPEAKNVRFVHANAVLPMRSRRNEIAARVRQYGFSVVQPGTGLFERAHDYFEKYLVWALLWAFHRRRPEMKAHTLRRIDLWTTRAEFLACYRPALAASAAIRGETEQPL
jgi:YkoP domain